MRTWFFAAALVAGLLALAACAAQEKVAPAPAPPAPAAQPGWEQEWERALAAAKREGTVTVVGAPGAELRRSLSESFERKYGIKVEYLGESSGAIVTRVKTERDAGQFLWDIYTTGTTTAITNLKPLGVFDPIEPALILPEVKDLKNWRGGKLTFSEKDRVNLVFGLAVRPAMAINTTLVKAQDFKSHKDLLDPKWKGKMVMGRDPRIAGAGQAAFTFYFMHKDLGHDYIRALLRQDVTMLRDDRQALEWLAQGRFPILIGPSEAVTEDFLEKRAPIALVDPGQLREKGYLSPANASLGLINRAPHPNAAKVYINWLLSKEGQTEYSKVNRIPSMRLDVPAETVDPWRIPTEAHLETYTEEAMKVKDPLMALLREILGP